MTSYNGSRLSAQGSLCMLPGPARVPTELEDLQSSNNATQPPIGR
jgi:hypothetical protein